MRQWIYRTATPEQLEQLARVGLIYDDVPNVETAAYLIEESAQRCEDKSELPARAPGPGSTGWPTLTRPGHAEP